MEEPKKLKPIELIPFEAPQSTNYGYTLAKSSWRGRTDWNNTPTTGICLLKMFSVLGLFSSGVLFIFWLTFFIFSGLPFTYSLISGLIVLASLGTLHLGAHLTGKENQKLLENPAKKFEWQIARAVVALNRRAQNWNGMLAAIELGKIELPEEERNTIHNELLASREELVLNIRMLDGMKNLPSERPELAGYLEELRDTKDKLLHELRGSEEGVHALSQNKIVAAIENERAYGELRLLPEGKK